MVGLSDCVGAGTGGLGLDIRFDNPLVESGIASQRYLELLVHTNRERGVVDSRLRRPLNIALVIDRSGSMGRNRKLENVKQAALAVLERLRPGDYFSLVVYDGNVRVPLPARAVGDLYRERSVISSLYPGGSTNLGGGLQEGYRQVRKYFSPAFVNRVLLFSDGHTNVGIQSPRELSAMALREAGYGISLSTLGVGLGFNEDLMAALSESGRGMYYFIDEPAKIQDILAREFLNIEQVMARDIRFTVTLSPGIEIAQVFANSFQVDGNTIHIQMGDLSAGELRRLQIRLMVTGLVAGNNDMGTVTMDYQPAGQNQRLVSTRTFSLTGTAVSQAVRRGRDQDVSDRSSVFEAHAARSRAAQAVDRGNLGEAERILKEMQRQLEAMSVQSDLVIREIRAVKNYSRTLRSPMSREERIRVQKRVKYRSYAIEGC
jgi:Ca-activated chloride channel family protein